MSPELANLSDGVGLFITGGAGNENMNFFGKYEDATVRLREIVLRGEETLTYYTLEDSGRDFEGGEYWSPDGPEDASSIVRDFYEDILQNRVGI